MPANAVLTIRLLGGFRVELGEQIVPDSAWRPKSAALVKLLALEPSHRLHREQVMETLWPDLVPGAAANNLRFTLHAARRALHGGVADGPFLARLGDGLVLGPPGNVTVDVDAFERAAAAAWQAPDPALSHAALELYAGELLPEDRFEDWAEGRRAALRAAFLALLARLAELHEGRDELGSAIAAWRRLLTAEPADEPAHAALMRLLAVTGRRWQSLAQYDALAAALERELGAEPEPATRALHQAIRNGAFPDRGGASRPTRAADPSVTVTPLAGPLVPLPVAVDALVGRRRELAELHRLVGEARLVTLTGPGGVGKTRLALSLAADLTDAFADGVAFVDLVAVRDPELVMPTLAQTLGVRDAGDRPVAERLADALWARHLLLVLDNFEQVIAAAPPVASLLTACHRLTVLVTSRVPLRLAGEHVFPVPPLGVPDVEAGVSAEAAGRSEAVRLFAARARAVEPGFVLNDANASAVVGIVRRLDGLPLAVELAAARSAALPPHGLLARLDRRLTVLTGGPRDAPDRQRTMRDAIAWSYDLLPASEQCLFRRLAVFAGGFALEAAEAVVGDGTDVLEGVTSLLAASMLWREEGPDGGVRFGILETVREFGLEQLAASGEEHVARSAHARFYRALGDEVGPESYGTPTPLVDRIAAEAGNLRVALDWAIDRGEGDTGLRLAHAFAALAFSHGQLSEGRAWLQRLLPFVQGVASSTVRTCALLDLGWLALMQGDATSASGTAAAIATDDGDADQIELAGALALQACVAMEVSNPHEARRLFGEALTLCRGRPGGTRREALVLNHLGLLTTIGGDPRGGAARYEEALALLAPDEEGVRALVLSNLAAVARDLGDLQWVATVNRQLVPLLSRLRSPHAASGVVWDGAELAVAAGRPRQATRLLAASLGLLEQAGYGFHSWNQPDLRRLTDAILAGLSEEAYTEAWAAGRAMAMEAAVAEAESVFVAWAVPGEAGSGREPTERAISKVHLTPRELQIVRLLGSGSTDQEIAEVLSVSRRTVEWHVGNLRGKLGAATRGEAAALAAREGLT